MAKPIKVGFDIGVHGVKIAIAQGATFRCLQARLPENVMEGDTITSPNAFSQFLHELKTKNHIPAGACALSLPDDQSICRFVSMPSMTEDQLAINLPYEFADFIQENDEEYFFDYALCNQTEKDAEDNVLPMMAAAAHKDILSTWEEIFSRAGFKLSRVLPAVMSLRALSERSKDEDVCFVDLGQQNTRVFLLHGDRVQATRDITIGCADIDAAIANHFDIDPYLASTYKETNFQDALTLPECMNVYERIGVELLKIINFYQFTYRENALRGIYLIGGGSNIAPLCKAVSDALSAENLPITEVLPEASGDYAYAVGVALGGE